MVHRLPVILGALVYLITISRAVAERLPIGNAAGAARGYTSITATRNRLTPVRRDVQWQSYFVGTFKIEGGKMVGLMYSKYLDPAGDTVVDEITQTGMERDARSLLGTGRFAGITGSATATPVNARPIVPGTSQGRSRITGSYVIK